MYLLLAATDISNIPLGLYHREQAARDAAANWPPELVISVARRLCFRDRDPAKVETISLFHAPAGTFAFVGVVIDFRPVVVRYDRDREVRIARNGVVTIVESSTGELCDSDLAANNHPEFFAALRTAITRHLERFK